MYTNSSPQSSLPVWKGAVVLFSFGFFFLRKRAIDSWSVLRLIGKMWISTFDRGKVLNCRSCHSVCANKGNVAMTAMPKISTDFNVLGWAGSSARNLGSKQWRLAKRQAWIHLFGFLAHYYNMNKSLNSFEHFIYL